MNKLLVVIIAATLSFGATAGPKPIVSNAEGESNSGIGGRNNYSIAIDSESGGGISISFGGKKPKAEAPAYVPQLPVAVDEIEAAADEIEANPAPVSTCRLCFWE